MTDYGDWKFINTGLMRFRDEGLGARAGIEDIRQRIPRKSRQKDGPQTPSPATRAITA